jgi:hypothetical protein
LKLVARKSCEAHQAGVQAFQLRFAHRIEMNAGSFARGLGRCNQRSRISAARGSETARARKPRSMSSSEGGLRSRRVARGGRGSRRRSPELEGVHRFSTVRRTGRSSHPDRSIRARSSDVW